MREKLNITAHSGCDGTAPDSVESIITGLRNGADGVEVDVRLDCDGHLVLSHDEEPGGRYPGRVPLDEAVRIIAKEGTALLNCDLKEARVLEAVLDLAEWYGLGKSRLVLTGSVSPALLRADRTITDRASVWINIEEVVEDYLSLDVEVFRPYGHLISPEARGDEREEAIYAVLGGSFDALLGTLITDCKALGADALNMPFLPQLVPFIPRIIQGGLPVSVWTLDQEKEVKEAVSLGVLNITTRNTPLVVELRTIDL